MVWGGIWLLWASDSDYGGSRVYWYLYVIRYLTAAWDVTMPTSRTLLMCRRKRGPELSFTMETWGAGWYGPYDTLNLPRTRKIIYPLKCSNDHLELESRGKTRIVRYFGRSKFLVKKLAASTQRACGCCFCILCNWSIEGGFLQTQHWYPVNQKRNVAGNGTTFFYVEWMAVRLIRTIRGVVLGVVLGQLREG